MRSMSAPSVLARHIPLIALTSVCVMLTSCSNVTRDVQSLTNAGVLTIQANQSIGQTFTSHHAGLNGIEIYLLPRSPGDGQIQLQLIQRASDGAIDGKLVTSSNIHVASVTRPNFYKFAFETQTDSRMRDYFISLQVIGDGILDIGIGPAESYLDGAAYVAGEPVDAQLALRLNFDPFGYGLGFARQTGEWFRILAAAIAMLVLPGWALIGLLGRPFNALPWSARLGWAVGASAALYPVLMLFSLIGIRLGPVGVGLVALFGIIGTVWHARKWIQSHPPHCVVISAPNFALLIVVGAVIISRFLAIGTLDIPLWGDSYQHTMIAQLIADNRGLFDSWLPYAELTSFTYHYGFHALVANFHWLTGLPVPQAILWMGQILNIAAVLTLGILLSKLSPSPWSTPVAILVAGLISSMPMFYLNWGRYTQLAGQVILPATIYVVWTALEGETRGQSRIGLIAIGIILMGGLALTHYRVLIFSTLFIPAYVLFNFEQLWPKRDVESWRVPAGLINLLAIGLGSGLLFLPQFARTLEGRITAGLAQKLSTPAHSVSEYLQSYNTIGDLSAYLPITVWGMMMLAIARALGRRDRNVLTFTGWWALLLLAANPAWLALPGTGVLSNFAVFIAAYIPAGILIGTLTDALPGDILRTRPTYMQRAAQILFVLSIAGLSIWGIPQRLNDLNVRMGTLVTRPDLLAANWVRLHLPTTARFLVNTFPAYGNTSIVGADGGWWLPLLTGRLTNLPPLTYSAERGITPDFLQSVNSLSYIVNAKGLDDPEVKRMLGDRGITHVFIGQRQGRVNNPNGPVLDVQLLLNNPNLRPIYHQDRVWIFEIRP